MRALLLLLALSLLFSVTAFVQNHGKINRPPVNLENENSTLRGVMSTNTYPKCNDLRGIGSASVHFTSFDQIGLTYPTPLIDLKPAAGRSATFIKMSKAAEAKKLEKERRKGLQPSDDKAAASKEKPKPKK